MFKFLALLFVFSFIAMNAYCATTSINGHVMSRWYMDTNVDQDKDTKTSGAASKNWFWNDVVVAANSQVTDQLKGKVQVGLSPSYEYWGDATTAGIFGTAGKAGPAVYFQEAWFDLMPLAGLDLKVGRQAFNYGNARLIGANNGAFFAQNGATFSYAMPEMFKADFMYSILDDDANEGLYSEEKAVKSDKFWAIWLNTPIVPFVQNLNLVYATNYKSNDAAADTGSNSKDNLDDTLTTMGIYAAGNAPVGPVKLSYSAEYYMNGGKNKINATEIKYKGTLMAFGIKGTMTDLLGLSLGIDYVDYSGDKTADGDEKAYVSVHGGANLYHDSGYLFSFSKYNTWDPGQGQTADAVDPGLNVIKAKVAAVPLENLSVSFEYIMLSAKAKEAMPANKTGAGTQMVLAATYTGFEGLKLNANVGQEKLNKDNFPNASGIAGLGKDGHTKVKLVAQYMF